MTMEEEGQYDGADLVIEPLMQIEVCNDGTDFPSLAECRRFSRNTDSPGRGSAASGMLLCRRASAKQDGSWQTKDSEVRFSRRRRGEGRSELE